MTDIYSIPKMDLSLIVNSELKNIIKTRMHSKTSNIIKLGHYIKIADNELLLGNTKIYANPSGFFEIDFNPFAELIDERRVIEYYLDEKKKDRLYLNDIADLIIKKSKDNKLLSYRFISNIKEDERNSELHNYTILRPEGMIKNHRGKFDVLATIQTAQYLKENFSHVENDFCVKYVSIDPEWKNQLREMKLNAGFSWYSLAKSISLPIDECLYYYHFKIERYAKEKGFL
ncbi:MAG: hypothetical protein KatS3mg002_0084 [Candidatus Woesearchaeota archaeon]|nr:MAG: hypothetical protein KatS3mg002_0084 [Candidatus Woesearchaeota archaeon]